MGEGEATEGDLVVSARRGLPEGGPIALGEPVTCAQDPLKFTEGPKRVATGEDTGPWREDWRALDTLTTGPPALCFFVY